MFRYPTAVLAAGLTLALAACAQDPQAPADRPDAADTIAPATEPAPPPMTDADGSCNADAVQGLVGQEATDEVVEQARTDAGAGTARTLSPGQVVTLEYREDRLNLDVDDAGIITGVRCG